MEFYKLGAAILKILLFGHFMAEKLPKKGGHIGFLAKNQNFQNRCTKFVELHTEYLQIKFQVPSI